MPDTDTTNNNKIGKPLKYDVQYQNALQRYEHVIAKQGKEVAAAA